MVKIVKKQLVKKTNLETLSLMTSVEIAELTEKNHSHVCRDIRIMLDEIYGRKKDDPNLDHIEIKGVFETRDKRGYVTKYSLDRNHTFTLVSGYRSDLRFKIISRWQELETKESASTKAEQDKFAAIKAHLERSTQVQNSKRANGMNYRIGGVKEVVSWNYTNCLEQTGYAPKDWREYGRSEGLPAKYCQSAKEVLRHMDQVAACCMSMADDVMVSNQRATPMDAIRIGKLSSPVFRELLALGIIPAELHWMNRESDKNAA